MAMTDRLNMLLVEPATLLRRTVALTARSLGLANVHEAASHSLALRLLKDTAFDGALIAFDSAMRPPWPRCARAASRACCSSRSRREIWSIRS
jgi:hypothetical protein